MGDRTGSPTRPHPPSLVEHPGRGRRRRRFATSSRSQFVHRFDTAGGEYATQLPPPRDQPRRPQGDYPVIVRLVHTDLSEEWRPGRAVRWTPTAVLAGWQQSAVVDEPKLSDFGLSPRHFRLGLADDLQRLHTIPLRSNIRKVIIDWPASFDSYLTGSNRRRPMVTSMRR